MRAVALLFLTVVMMTTLACPSGQTELPIQPPVSEPTPDIPATVAAGIRGTQTAEAAIDATVEARVAATLTTFYPTNTPRPIARPYPTATPRPANTPWPTATPAPVEKLTLTEYADRYANGPGAIYVGNLAQLAGPATSFDLTGIEGEVPLHAIERHRWIFESDYYASVLEKANLENPTPLTSSGEKVAIQYACLSRYTLPCILIEQYWAPNLERRTRGQLELVVSSFPEFGLTSANGLQLVSDGVLAMATTPLVADRLPQVEVQSLWGLYPDHQTAFESVTTMLPDLDAILSEESDGGIVINHSWFIGYDLFLFSLKPIRDLSDFEGLKIRNFSAAFSDWLEGMSAEGQPVGFADVYTALERGRLDAGVSMPASAFDQRWYEVTNYINGPLIGWPATANIINPELWDQIPTDLQQIFLEEGAKSELEQLRLAPDQTLAGVEYNLSARLELVELSPDSAKHSFNVAAMQHVIPGWLQRLNNANQGHLAVAIFNKNVGPYVGLSIEPDGSVEQAPITAGPHAGKTMEQVLSK